MDASTGIGTLRRTSLKQVAQIDSAQNPIGKTRPKWPQTKLISIELKALEAFKLLRAPLDGIVTARDVDIGAYVRLKWLAGEE
ncbi:MAG TPA: hypothetical protein VNY04_03675 [Chthoniobacterales bacterium]|nr:hypothetical protein [Chthoniobacterales bacterium]